VDQVLTAARAVGRLLARDERGSLR
jgi:hypothetical protein